MLATLVIGLREGLEAALIVGIIAAFLGRNGASLKPMWIGVCTALGLSIAVGFILQVIEASLPQAAQEGMEAVIGAVAIVFVTTMIVWMKRHARGMKKALERDAAAALGAGTTWALAGMAFLAVLKEGFETSVFLLATFQASTSAGAAALGAVVGILGAIGIGIGIYSGGVRLNLSRFFTVTGVFLVFVAAGLVVTMLRTAHEAGWIAFGQQRTVDLSWLAPTGSVQAALLTGVLGIPSDPRLIEVLGWLLYVVPVLAYSLWPKRLRLPGTAVAKALLGSAAVLGFAAIALAVAVPAGSPAAVPASAPLTNGGSATFHPEGTGARLALSGSTGAEYRFGTSSPTSHSGADRLWSTTTTRSAAQPATIGLDSLMRLSGDRVPVGIDPARAPGPYSARWTSTTEVIAYTLGDGLVDASGTVRTVVTVSGGGLVAPRSYAVDGQGAEWSVPARSVAAANDAIQAAHASAGEALLWKLWLPVALGIAAVALAVKGMLTLGAARSPGSRSDDPAPDAVRVGTPPTAWAAPSTPAAAPVRTAGAVSSSPRSTSHAAE